MSSNYKEEEARILEAVEAFRTKKNASAASLAREFGVSVDRLRRRIRGVPSRSTRPKVTGPLSKEQEQALQKWIENLDEMGVPPTAETIRNCANSMIHRSDPDARGVGKNWPYNFIQWLGPEYKRVKQKPMDPNRLAATDISVIDSWFDRLEIQLRINKIQPENLYNFDETGFRIGQGKREKVITAYPDDAIHIPSDSSRISVTVVECIAAKGWVMPPFIIFPGKQHLEDWYTQDLPEDYRIGVSNNGYITDELAFQWIQHFDEHTRHRAAGKKRLLLMDNHGSHLTYEFIQFCDRKHIILYCFPPHTTHILQPLDHTPFQQYKHYHGKSINAISRLGIQEVDKHEFLHQLVGIWRSTFKPRTIKSGFEGRGIWPFDPAIVVDPLRKKYIDENEPVLEMWDGDTPPPQPEPLLSSSISPPTTVNRLQHSIKKAQASLQDDGATPSSVQRRLDRIFTGSLIQAELAAQCQDDVEKLLRANQRKTRKKTRRTLQLKGTLSVKDANRRIEARSIEQMEKDNKRAKRDQEVVEKENQRIASQQPKKGNTETECGSSLPTTPDT